MNTSEQEQLYKNAQDLLDEGAEGVEKGVQILKSLAEAGYTPAMVSLGDCYYYGSGVEEDLEQYARWNRIAAEAGNPQAQNNLGQCYLFGEGVDEDVCEAFRWMKMAAEGGVPVAQFNVGVMYENGEGTDQSDEQAFLWYKKAAENGYERAFNTVGTCYSKGLGTQTDDTAAAYWFKRAADTGDAVGMYNLGLCYRNGWGVEENAHEAIKCFEESALEGDEDAMRMVVSDPDMYCMRSIPPDVKLPEDAKEQYEYATSILSESPDEAIEILTGLGNKGHLPSQEKLISYYYSYLDPPDTELMAYWVFTEAIYFNIDAILLAATLITGGVGVRQSELWAFRWIDRWLRVYPDDPRLQTKLALYYIDGTGVKKDIAAGTELLTRAANAGHAHAQDRLGMVKFYFEKKPEEALMWLGRAKQGGYEKADSDIAIVQDGMRRNERIRQLVDRKFALEEELGNLRGLFSGKRRKEIEGELAQIERELGQMRG